MKMHMGRIEILEERTVKLLFFGTINAKGVPGNWNV